MPPEDEMQVGVFYARTIALGSAGVPVELGGGEGNLVRIWACHWNLEKTPTQDGPFDGFLGMALSSNPEHEGTPPFTFADFQSDPALYARAIYLYAHDGIGDTTSFLNNKIVPCYGLVRPRRQIMTVLNLWTGLDIFTGVGLEVYYTPWSVPLTEREEINRKYGKYRRS